MPVQLYRGNYEEDESNGRSRRVGRGHHVDNWVGVGGVGFLAG